MAKVAVLVPNQEMSTIAKSLTGEFPSISLMAIESIQTDQAVRRAGELEQQGCDLIVARGVQARAIKRSVKLPLVEISVSQQELASVVLELKEELGLPCPRIGLIGLSNMFSDTSQFDRLFGIDLDLYMVEQNDELAAAAVRAFPTDAMPSSAAISSARMPGGKNCPISSFLPAWKACATP